MSAVQSLIAENRARLPQFVFYDRPRDFPDHIVARLWWTLPEPKATGFFIRCAQAEPLREVMEAAGLVKLMRDPSDDPSILEVWL